MFTQKDSEGLEVLAKSVSRRSSSKRSRAAEVHNLSEKVVSQCYNLSYIMRVCFYIWSYDFWVVLIWLIGGQRRRSRINEKMKALQNLIPNSNKVLYLLPLMSLIFQMIASVNFFFPILFLFDRRIRLLCWMKRSNI